ncbi:MAG: signal peptidase I [Candidatus Eremiobacteraeota bacterium]|nr:signal peptidase I [Candidatus Eremiobacteraeota bacterium]
MGIARAALSTKPFATGAATTARVYLDVLIAAGLVALFLITFVIRTFYIPSVSMVPTLQVHDVVLVDEIAYRLHPPAHGDVAVFTPPVNSAGSDYVKRVVGVPGDRIAIADGTVYRNGSALREPYENQPPRYTLAIRNHGIYVNGAALDPRRANVPPRSAWQAPDRVPNGYFFVLGDDRNYSDDSHAWGFVPAKNFVGRAFFIIWPLERVRALDR